MLAYSNASFPAGMRPFAGRPSTAPRLFAVPSPIDVYVPNAEIFVEDQKASALYQVAFGAVRVYRLLADGRRQISAFHFAGEVFGLAPGERHEFSAEAIVTTGVRVLRPSASSDFTPHLLEIALHGLARAQRHLLLLGRKTAPEKVASFLLDMAERQGNDNHVDLPMQRCDIGDYLGLTLETVSRTFAKLRDDRLVRLTTARSIEIVDIRALEAISG